MDERGTSEITLPQSLPNRYPTTLMDQAFYLLRKTSDMQIHCIIAFDGTLDSERLQTAVTHTFTLHPILACRFVEDKWRPYWERILYLAPRKYFEFTRTTDPERELLRFMASTMDPTKEPQLKLNLIRSDADTDTLCIKINHHVSDAAGLLQYLYVLTRIYRALIEDAEYHPPDPGHAYRGLRQISSQLTVGQKLRLFCQNFKDLPVILYPNRLPLFPYKNGPESEREFMFRTIVPARFRALRAFGRAQKATITEILITAYLRALFSPVYDPGCLASHNRRPLWVQTTADLRRYSPLEVNEPIRNLSGPVFLTIGSDLGVSFNETLRKVKTVLGTKRSRHIGLTNWAAAAVMFKPRAFQWTRWRFNLALRAGVRLKRFPFAISNAGVIDATEVDFGGPKINNAFLTAPVMYPPFFCIGASGFREGITLSAGYCEPTVKRADVEQLFDRLFNELPE